MNVWPAAGLVDHLLVQLAHPRAVGQHHGVEAAVGDRARVLHGQRPRDPSRPRTIPVVRSQTTRGRSSANSSDG